jgi:rubredoxin
MKKRAKTRIGDTSARMPAPKPLMECRVCWRVYDPAEGDPVWRIEPGVAFEDLPADSRVPNTTRHRINS